VVAGSTATDVILIRNFNPTPQPGMTAPPSLRDIAVIAVDAGGLGRLVISDVSARGHPSSSRTALSDPNHQFTLSLPSPPLALAHISPDVSDPFVYAAVGTAGVSVIQIAGPPSASATAATLLTTVPLPVNRTATAAVLAGDMLYVGTAEGTIEALSLADPTSPIPMGGATIGQPVTSLATAGFTLFVGTDTGLGALALDIPTMPMPLTGAAGAIVSPGLAVKNMAVMGNHLYIATGTGVHDLDIRTIAQPIDLGDLVPGLAPAQSINAQDIVVSKLAGQTWLLVLDGVTGDLWGLKLDNRLARQERCYPNPSMANCLLDLDFMDPTISGRDPSFDPLTQTFDATDPSSPTFIHFTHTIIGAGTRLARPSIWEQIGTLTGRRLRDSFMPGSSVLSLPVMQQMRSVKLCESGATSTTPEGLGALGLADAGFMSGGPCQPLGTSARLALFRPKQACKLGDTAP